VFFLKDHPELSILGITTQDIAIRAQLGKRLPLNRTNHNAGSETKTPTKKKKGETGNNKGMPTTVAGHISQMRHSLSSPQVGCSLLLLYYFRFLIMNFVYSGCVCSRSKHR
jgi:hypothetical protein